MALPEIAEPETESRPAPSVGNAKEDWLCAWCHNRVASEKDRFAYDGQTEFTFFNPEGVCFEIILFAQTIGCLQTGVPTQAHTWFAHHAWSFCQCDSCGIHLGWYYTGPQEFVGLIKNRIARALYLRN